MDLKKKGQGLPLNTIIIAIIVVVVLVIVILIFTNNIGGFARTANTCAAKGGTCADSCAPNTQIQIEGTCTDKAQVCCAGINT